MNYPRPDDDIVPSFDARDPEPCPLPMDLTTLAVAAVIVLATVLVSCVRPWGFA